MYDCNSILSGSIAEKMKFIPYLLFSNMDCSCIQSSSTWVWGGGWINKLGVLDFAGGTVVHITSGVSGLVLAIMIEKETNILNHHIILSLR